MSDQTNFEVEFKAQKPLPKAEVMKLKPGDWLLIKFLDAPNEPALLLRKPERGIGDVDLSLYFPRERRVDWRTTHTQVVKVIVRQDDYLKSIGMLQPYLSK